MEKTLFRRMFLERTADGDDFSASILDVTKFVSILFLIFAAFTQVLAWIGAITLSTTLQVAIWLGVAGLIVLLSIADMACRAYVTAKRYEASAARRLEEPPSPPSQQVAPPPTPTGEPPRLWPVPSGNGNPGDGSRLAVNMADVFPHGAYLVRGSINEAQDCDDSIETRPVVDKRTGKRVFQVEVVDGEEGQPQPRVVKVVANRMPDMPPPANGSSFTAVEFEGLTVASYATNRGRPTYSSLRATGIRPAPARGPEKKETV